MLSPFWIHYDIPESARHAPGRKFRTLEMTIRNQCPIGTFLRCRSHQWLKLSGEWTNEEMVVEMPLKYIEMNGIQAQRTEWTNEPMSQRINEPVNQWINQSMNQWIDKSVNQWIDDSVNQWINESMNQWMKEWTEGWMNGWASYFSLLSYTAILLFWATSSLMHLFSQLLLLWAATDLGYFCSELPPS